MDQTGILALLVVVTALNSVILLVLTGATLRGLRARPAVGPSVTESDLAEWSRTAPIPARARTEPAAAIASDLAVALGPDPAAAIGADPAAAAADPLAGAISAFLTRSDGLFRAGAAPPPRPAQPAAWALSADAGAPSPPAVAGEPRASRLVRHVASAPRSTGPRPTIDPAPVLEAPGASVAAGNVPPPALGGNVPPPPLDSEPPLSVSPAAGFAVPRPTRPVSRVSIWFVGRDASRSAVEPGTIARLAPVIGGLLRERTRAEDLVAVVGGGRFLVDLPDTPIDGGAALTRRLADSCDAWLAAEQPPLRLEFGMSESLAVAGPRPDRSDRDPGLDRRRTVPLDA